MSRIVVYSRVGCHLCEDALQIVGQVATAADEIVVIDIDVDADFLRTGQHDDYTIRVPVIEVDGVEIAQYQVDATTLALALA